MFNFAKWIVVGSDFIGVLHLEDGRQDSHLMVNILESRPVYCGSARCQQDCLAFSHWAAQSIPSLGLVPSRQLKRISLVSAHTSWQEVAACEAVIKKSRYRHLGRRHPPMYEFNCRDASVLLKNSDKIGKIGLKARALCFL